MIAHGVFIYKIYKHENKMLNSQLKIQSYIDK